jgi:polysaccharide export outer membrane protein
MSRQTAVVMSLVLAGCKLPSAHQDPSTLTAEDAIAHHEKAPFQPGALGPGDVIEVRVFEEPDLSGAFRLGAESDIQFPLCQTVRLGGLTPSQAAGVLTDCLKQRFLKNPNVSVLLREYNSKKVLVFGEVAKPGTYPFDGSLSVLQAILAAGGFTHAAAKNSCNVTRDISGVEKRIKIQVEDIAEGKAPDFPLEPGDIVFVPESLF